MVKAKIIGAHDDGRGGGAMFAIEVTQSVGVGTTINIGDRQFNVHYIAVERDDFLETDVIFGVTPV